MVEIYSNIRIYVINDTYMFFKEVNRSGEHSGEDPAARALIKGIKISDIQEWSPTKPTGGSGSGQKGGRKKRRTRKQKGGDKKEWPRGGDRRGAIDDFGLYDIGILVWNRSDNPDTKREYKVRIIGYLVTDKVVNGISIKNHDLIIEFLPSDQFPLPPPPPEGHPGIDGFTGPKYPLIRS